MKYEYLAGNPGMFIGMPSRVVVLVNAPHSVEGLTSFGDVVKTGMPVIAMRRIIAEPKRWTIEDQKAGQLPEVDCVVRATGIDEDARIAAINNDSVCVVFEDGAFVTLHVSGIAPIEMPEEKAQREEDEWVNKAWGETAVFAGVAQDEHDRLRIHLRHIYKAQLSGELQAPKGGE